MNPIQSDEDGLEMATQLAIYPKLHGMVRKLVRGDLVRPQQWKMGVVVCMEVVVQGQKQKKDWHGQNTPDGFTADIQPTI